MKKTIFLALILTLLVSGCTVRVSNPDLSISNLNYDEITNTVSMKVSNEGTASSKSFSVEVYEGDNFLGSKEVVGLGEGGSVTTTISGVNLLEGTHIIRAVADPQNLITEISERNNEIEETVTIGDEANGGETTPEEVNLTQLILRGKSQNVHYLANLTLENFSTTDTTEYTTEVWSSNGKVRVFSDNIQFAGKSIQIEAVEVDNENIIYQRFIDPNSSEQASWSAMTRGRYEYEDASQPVATVTVDHYLHTLYELENATENTIIGREKLGSRDTLVVDSFSHPNKVNGKSDERKVWIWIEKGIPIKEEKITDQTKTTTTLTQIDFDPIAESVFDIQGNIDYSGVEVNEPSLSISLFTYKDGIFKENDEGSGPSMTLNEKTYQSIPVQGALVEITGIDNSNADSCLTDSEGKCKIKPFEAGKYTMKITKIGCQAYEQEYTAERNIAYQFSTLACEDWPFS